jgi:hypothetical protein
MQGGHMKKIKALTNFGGRDAGRSGKMVIMAEGDDQDVSDEFAKDVVQAGHAELVAEKKAKV